MGPNGSGKSTLALALAGHPRYKITAGTILIDGVDVSALPADERAKRGLFLSFQHPPAIPGVTVEHFLRTAYASCTGQEQDVLAFHRRLLEQMDRLRIDHSFARRYLNEGFSGGERKRMEILQLRILNRSYAILDETDSGLDVDALRVVSDGISGLRDKDHCVLIITHFNRILQHVPPDHVHILKDGRIVRSGGKELAHEVEKSGYDTQS
jgi:Fe-S cluster assembly ATP-binding protein